MRVVLPSGRPLQPTALRRWGRRAVSGLQSVELGPPVPQAQHDRNRATLAQVRAPCRREEALPAGRGEPRGWLGTPGSISARSSAEMLLLSVGPMIGPHASRFDCRRVPIVHRRSLHGKAQTSTASSGSLLCPTLILCPDSGAARGLEPTTSARPPPAPGLSPRRWFGRRRLHMDHGTYSAVLGIIAYLFWWVVLAVLCAIR